MESQNGDIFDAISHEIRRKIIQLLAEKPKTFSELQKDRVRQSGTGFSH
jgi:hypothetical protein